MWRHEQPRRCDARRRTRRGLRDVRRTQTRRLSAVVRDGYRTHRVVGRAFHRALRRLRGWIHEIGPLVAEAPISSRSATASGAIRAARRQPSRRPRGSLLRRSLRHERPASRGRATGCRAQRAGWAQPMPPAPKPAAVQPLQPPPASRTLPTRNTSAATTSRRSRRQRAGSRRKAIRKP